MFRIARPLAVALLAGSFMASATAVPAASDSRGRCSADAELVDFSDALNKRSFAQTAVGGLSAITLDPRRPHRARALVDNQS